MPMLILLLFEARLALRLLRFGLKVASALVMVAVATRIDNAKDCMPGSLTSSEEAQLAQTVEMFEVITQSQPQDYQSLEILKEAYFKLGREKDVIITSKRIAQAYVQMGQLSSAILEYESVLQRHPHDLDVQAALKEIESKANNFPVDAPPEPVHKKSGDTITINKPMGKTAHPEVEDGRRTMHKLFVDSRVI